MPGEQLPLDLEGLEPYTPPAPPPPPPKQQPWEPPPRPARQPKPEAPVAKPFSYTQALGEVVRDVIATLPELAHVDQSRILLAISQARQASKHGVYATCMPLRFEGGVKESVYNGRRYAWPVLHHEEREILYLIRNEHVETVADVLLRRTTIAITGALSLSALDAVLGLLATERNWSPARRANERSTFLAELADKHGLDEATLSSRDESRNAKWPATKSA